MQWALIPCSKKKAAAPCMAWEMYWPSALFRGAWEAANRRHEGILILSAKHGLIFPRTIMEPYEETLTDKPQAHRREWTCRVLESLSHILRYRDRITNYCGAAYNEYLVPALRENGFEVDEPLKGLSQGQRLQWFKRHAEVRGGGWVRRWTHT